MPRFPIRGQLLYAGWRISVYVTFTRLTTTSSRSNSKFVHIPMPGSEDIVPCSHSDRKLAALRIRRAICLGAASAQAGSSTLQDSLKSLSPFILGRNCLPLFQIPHMGRCFAFVTLQGSHSFEEVAGEKQEGDKHQFHLSTFLRAHSFWDCWQILTLLSVRRC